MADVGYGFFPTGQEVFAGIKWIKEHPMVVTAAAVGATALSIVTYRRAAKDDDDERHKQHVVSWCDIHVKVNAARPETSPNEDHVNDINNRRHQHGSTNSNSSSSSDTSDILVQEFQALDVQRKEAEDARVDMDPSTLHNASPQWGWYVAITPPRDLVSPGLPRAVTDPREMINPTMSSLKRTQSARLR
ncbi:hypothetical protein AC1031_019857 [Aphanomyces cochlioides]|nr:hypothetical protein AC1031_019857 [Aphanomyces cochlioides]